jgi:hypothetical protein
MNEWTAEYFSFVFRLKDEFLFKLRFIINNMYVEV